MTEDEKAIEAYHVFPGTMRDICCLVLRDGVTGESAAVTMDSRDEVYALLDRLRRRFISNIMSVDDA